MKIEISRDKFYQALSGIAGVAEPSSDRAALEISANVLLSANEGRLQLVTSSGDCQMSCRIQASISSAGEITTPAHKLLDILRLLPSNRPVRISVVGEKLIITSGQHRRFTLCSLPADEFPSLSLDLSSADPFSLSNLSARSLFRQVSFAMSTESDKRAYLIGTCLTVGSGSIEAAATDGKRIAYSREKCDFKGVRRRVIVPRKAVKLLEKMIGGTEQEVEFSLSLEGCRFSSGGLTLESNLVQGTFPDYQPIIKPSGDRSLLVNREELNRAVDQLLPIGDKQAKHIDLDGVEDGAMVLFASSNRKDSGLYDTGKCKAAVFQPDDRDHPEWPITFNGKYLKDALSVFSGELVRLSACSSNADSLVFTDDEDKQTTQVVAAIGASGGKSESGAGDRSSAQAG